MSERVTKTREARQDERPMEAPDKLAWETPEMEDVSEQVMAQPYIRFT
jgi:hypothetical protein